MAGLTESDYLTLIHSRAYTQTRHQPCIMPTPFISVIVPIYKVGAFLQECIDSILAQTFTDFELILVDDGSPDDSGVICDQAATRDSRIRVIHQKNQGATRARANGVAAARGEYIHFVDGDDSLPPHALATLAEHAKEDIDIILGRVPGKLCPPKGIITAEEYREACVTLKNTFEGPVAKLFRRSLYTDEVFDIPPDIIMGEDDIMNLRLAYRVKGRVYSTCTEVYNYRKNPNSTTNTFQSLETKLKAEKFLLKLIPKEDYDHLLSRGLARRYTSQWLNYSRPHIIIPKSEREHYQYICNIREHAKIKFGPLSYILCYCSNPLIRAIFVPLDQIIYAIRKGNK